MPISSPQVDFILNGLAAAHSVGIIHRDLKPENVLIDRYRRWRLADFGIANVTGEEVTGASGTPAFASPEQLLGEQQEMSLGSVGDALGLSPSRVSRLADELYGRGLLRRRAGFEDRRVVLVSLTAKGRRALTVEP